MIAGLKHGFVERKKKELYEALMARTCDHFPSKYRDCLCGRKGSVLERDGKPMITQPKARHGIPIPFGVIVTHADIPADCYSYDVVWVDFAIDIYI